MKKYEIHLWDVKRILLGQAPPEFLLEVFIRTLIIYLVAIAVTRLLGKRMNGQLSILEFSVMLVMGAIVSPAMQLPDRGLLQAVLVLLVTLCYLRGINWLSFRKKGFEKLTQSDVAVLVKDGVVQLDKLNAMKISRHQLFAALREKKVMQLGKVKRFYLEACGYFSLYQEKEPKAGLPIVPPGDERMVQSQQYAPDPACVCSNCGLLYPEGANRKACSHCGDQKFERAVF